MPRAVLDANVLVSALLTPEGASARLSIEFRAGAFELVASPRLLLELRNVLKRERFRRHVSAAQADAYVDWLRRESIVIDDPELADERLSADPGDEYVIALARVARANALVSGDSHLTSLAGRIPVRTPREFLDSLR